MRQFAEYCNYLLKSEDLNVYHFCTVHSLERTGIRRMLKGERMPKPELFWNFYKSLSLTPDESKKLLELYQRELVGDARYENRVYIGALLEYIGEFLELPRDYTPVSAVPAPPGRPLTSLGSRLELKAQIRRITKSEHGPLYSNFDGESGELLQILQEEFTGRQDKNVSLFHLFSAEKKTAAGFDVMNNLRLLKNILSFSIQDGRSYQPYYCYGQGPGSPDTNPFPFFLLSSESLLLVSASQNRGVLLMEPSVLECFRAEVLGLLNTMKPFVYRADDLTSTSDFYIKNCMAGAQPAYTLNHYPCPMQAYTGQMLMDSLAVPPEQVAPVLQILDRLTGMAQTIFPYEEFLSTEGLERFIRTGEAGPWSRDVLRPFDLPTRRLALRNMEEHCMDGCCRLHILPRGFYQKFVKFSLELYSDRRMLIYSADSLDSFILMDEGSIYAAFQDYFQSLLDNPRITSVEETVALLGKYRRSMEA